MNNQHLSNNHLCTSDNKILNSHSFHLILFSNTDEMHDLWLPETPEGFFRISDSPEHRFLSIVAKDGQWFAVCKKPAFIKNVPLDRSFDVPLESGQLLFVDFDDKIYTLYVEKVSRGQRLFRNFFIRSETEITIGSRGDNDVFCDNPYISGLHAVLKYSSAKWTIRDCGSKNGFFVNGIKKISAELQIGDLISILGLRMIVGAGFLSISTGASKVVVNQRILQDTKSFRSGYSYNYGQEPTDDAADNPFNRQPRKRIEMNIQPISVEGPPMSMNQNKMPLILRMGSSVVMGGAAALAGNFMTLISSVMFPFLSSKYTDKQRQEYEALRFTKYTEYLESKRKEILQTARCEKEWLNKRYPEINQLIEIVHQKYNLWERRPMDSDFLEVRLGTGTQPLKASIEYPPRRFELEQDELEEKMYSLVEAPYYVENVPVVLSLPETRVCGLLGPTELVFSYIYQLALQISVLHSYDEVKMLFFAKEEEFAQLDEIRYLPHVWDDQKSIRFLATEGAEAYKLGEYISAQISIDKEGEQDLQKVLKNRPYYIIFALNKKLFESHEALKNLLQSEEMRGVSIIAAYDDLPKESQKIIALANNNQNVCTTMSADGGEDEIFRLDYYNRSNLRDAMRTLMNISLKTVTQAQEIPKLVTFLELFKAGRVEQLNPLKRWRENNPIKSLAAPVGVGEDGSLFMLDLHEKRQGPHGLVAGMTGSGKSEFIITYILSMAINYHPDEVTFLLIDYKGGGLAGAFDNPQTGVHLPHLVGTITNLDGASIQRSLMSIESELKRRQKIFNEVKSAVNEGTMDIYDYQKLYREGKVSEPMPHLLIISDEFAELKQQQPEFMDKLISAARIGRSLGVHLILATQKPSGVVNDQIRSNTKFRVCLRVQDRSDSMDMLKRPEAAELTDAGRFYLQVGYNEYFALGQSAWCGAPYEPQDTVQVQRDDAVEFLDTTGQVVAKAKQKLKKVDSGMKQIVAVVQYLSELAKKENIKPRQLWMEPLTDSYDVDLLDDGKINDASTEISTVIGVVDDPQLQQQFLLNINIQDLRHLLIIGSSGSGKTSMLKSMLYSISKNYSCEKVNYYILDFSGGTLSAFRNAPHCGAFLTDSNEAEIDRFLSMLKEMIKERKRLFGDAGVTSYEAYTMIQPLPLVVVAIDNVSGLSSLNKGNTYYSTLHEYLKDSPSLGIKVIITCSNMSELSMRSKQEILDRIALQMKDKYEYSDVLNCRGNYTPAAFPGRGLCVQDGRLLEYQAALPFADKSEQDRTIMITQAMQQISIRDRECNPARRLPVISDSETYEHFCEDIRPGRIPLGYELKNISKVSIPFVQLFCASVYIGNPMGTKSIMSNFIYAAMHNKMELIIVKRSEKSVFDLNPCIWGDYRNVTMVDSSGESTLKLCELLIKEIKNRKAHRNQFCAQNNISPELAKLPETLKSAARYIHQHTTPLLILIEDFLEFSTNMSGSSFSVYKEIFLNGKGYNFYFVSCFYPEHKDKLGADLMVKNYAEESLMMFFGGQFQNQALTTLPMEYRKITEPNKQYNRFLLRYNNTFHPLVMPCGEITEEEVDPDYRPIV